MHLNCLIERKYIVKNYKNYTFLSNREDFVL